MLFKSDLQLFQLLLIPFGKDNTTEGEKKTQEKVAATEGKGKQLVIEGGGGVSSFSHILEEGEIDEPYVPEIYGRCVH